MELFKKLNAEGTTIIQVTHSGKNATYGNRVIKIRRRLDRVISRWRIARILIADDQPDVLEALRLLLKGEGYRTESANSPAAVLAALESRDFDVRPDGPELHARHDVRRRKGWICCTRIQALDPPLPVVVMTAWGSVELAVEAMRRGARDFIQKPWDNARLLVDRPNADRTGQALRTGTAAGGGEPRAARRRQSGS